MIVSKYPLTVKRRELYRFYFESAVWGYVYPSWAGRMGNMLTAISSDFTTALAHKEYHPALIFDDDSSPPTEDLDLTKDSS